MKSVQDFEQALLKLRTASGNVSASFESNQAPTDIYKNINEFEAAINVFKECSEPSHVLFDTYLEAQAGIRNYMNRLKADIQRYNKLISQDTDSKQIVKDVPSFLPTYLLKYTPSKRRYAKFLSELSDRYEFINGKTFIYIPDEKACCIRMKGNITDIKNFLLNNLQVDKMVFDCCCAYEVIPIATPKTIFTNITLSPSQISTSQNTPKSGLQINDTTRRLS